MTALLCSAIGVSGCVQKYEGLIVIDVTVDSDVRSKCFTIRASDSTQMPNYNEGKRAFTIGIPRGTRDAGIKSIHVAITGFENDDCTLASVPNVFGEGTFDFSDAKNVERQSIRVSRSSIDSGIVDAGLDSGEINSSVDAGNTDAGPADAGAVAGSDAGKIDAGFDAGTVDTDGDGDPDSTDCAISDATVFHSAQETLCSDKKDNDCDGTVDCNDGNCQTMNCTNGSSCTSLNACQMDGGCGSSISACPASNECQMPTGCSEDAGCTYAPRQRGWLCQNGIGLCDNGVCIGNRFPYTPSNFSELDLLGFDAGTVGLTINCDAGINTDSPPNTICGQPFARKTIVQDGGPPVLLIVVPSLQVNAQRTLRITGSKVLIFSVLGDAGIDGQILANSDAFQNQALDESHCNSASGGQTAGTGSDTRGGGGGGGGFLHDGGMGGNTGNGAAGGRGGSRLQLMSLSSPLLGGCSGASGGDGQGSGGLGGKGGGAFQVSAGNQLRISGIVSTSGRGGFGGSIRHGGGGGAGSGGMSVFEARSVVLNGAKLTSNGGAGGEAGDFDELGRGGEHGAINSASAAVSPGTTSCGGVGGAGGTDFPPVSAEPFGTSGNGACSDSGGGGGGGGSAGRIVIRSISCTKLNGPVISPLHFGTPCL
jgi:hypothetical protein